MGVESVITLDKKKYTEKDAMILYDHLTNIYKQQVYDCGGSLATIGTADDEVGKILVMSKIKHMDMRTLFPSKDAYDNIHKWIIKNKRFSTRPYLVQRMSITTSGVFNKGINKKNVLQFMNKDDAVYANLRNGQVIYNYGYPKVIDDKVEKFDELLNIIFKSKTNLVKRWMAQIIFERRIMRSKPTLVIYGVRGSGKNFFVEQIMGRIMSPMMCPVGMNWTSFNGFMRNRLVYLDENEADMDIKTVSQFAKKISGSNIIDINIKNLSNYRHMNECNLVLLANRKPVNITEVPHSEKNNQWIVVNMREALSTNNSFRAFCDENGNDLSHFIEKNIGAYIREVLLPLYYEYMGSEEYRYGFPIPVDDDVISLVNLSYNNITDSIDNIMDTLVMFNYNEFRQKFKLESDPVHEELLIAFQKQGFLSNEVMTILSNKMNMEFSKLAKAFRASPYYKKPTFKKVRGKTRRGMLIDLMSYKRSLERLENIDAIDLDINEIMESEDYELLEL